MSRSLLFLLSELTLLSLNSYGPACWLWDYLRRSSTSGYFVPLSGGIDSCATATIVFSMCRLVCKAAQEGSAFPLLPSCLPFPSIDSPSPASDEQVISDARRITGEPEGSDYVPVDPREFCGRIFHTTYMGTSNSSEETRGRAKGLAEAIGA
jgi:NAD+ synthase (glutamine-hydrolysing)